MLSLTETLSDDSPFEWAENPENEEPVGVENPENEVPGDSEIESAPSVSKTESTIISSSFKSETPGE
jgi:hypothetical protein